MAQEVIPSFPARIGPVNIYDYDSYINTCFTRSFERCPGL